jgi:(1->4)-alpha-D-glucan 1-alpha-D-glucosylmutase
MDDAERRACQLRFVRRFQQFTAPVMAKAMEDTAFYRFHRLCALNDVGGEPRRFGHDADAFHAANGERAARTPHTLLATSTHDSKRSEDVRARLAVLSEMPSAWADALRHWHELAGAQWRIAGLEQAPERNDEMLLFQTLVGIWPDGSPGDATPLESLRERVVAYMLKAVREAKQHSSWLDADTGYEQGLQRAVEVLLARLEPNPLLTDLRAFVERLAPFGCVNSLALVVLKLTSPGVPDLYQGNEDWQHALVDPDNRRPVDWERLSARLDRADALDAATLSSQALPGGLHKLFVTARLLRWRGQAAALFRDGDYTPLAVQGPRADHIVAFLRRRGGSACLSIVPRRVWQATEGRIEALADGRCWRGTRVVLPADAPRRWRNVLTGREVAAQADVAVDLALQELCIAVLHPFDGAATQGGHERPVHRTRGSNPAAPP